MYLLRSSHERYGRLQQFGRPKVRGMFGQRSAAAAHKSTSALRRAVASRGQIMSGGGA